VLGHSDYHYRHETLFYGRMPGVGGHVVPLDRAQDSLWEAKKPARNEQHPTMKPPELYERALLNSSNIDDVVFDSFGGSGTAIRHARINEKLDDIRYALAQATGKPIDTIAIPPSIACLVAIDPVQLQAMSGLASTISPETLATELAALAEG